MVSPAGTLVMLEGDPETALVYIAGAYYIVSRCWRSDRPGRLGFRNGGTPLPPPPAGGAQLPFLPEPECALPAPFRIACDIYSGALREANSARLSDYFGRQGR
jgi:hypothetical protein